MIVLGNILKRIFSKKMNIVFLLVVPTIINIFILYTSTIDTKYSIGILDKDNTQLTQDFIKYMEESARVVKVKENADMQALILNDGLECVFELEKGYTADLIAGKSVSVKSYSYENSNYAEPVQMNAASYMSAAKAIASASKGNEKVFYEGMADYNKKAFSVEYLYSGSTDSAGKDSAVSAFGYIAFCLVFMMTSATALQMEDKTSGVINRITVSPIRRASYYVQHMLGSLIISLIQVVAVILILPLVSKVSFGSSITDILEVIIVCGVFSIACISIGTIINRYSSNRKVSSSITSLINLPMLMLGGCMWSRDLMPDFLQKIGNFMPTTWFLNAADKIIHDGSLMDAGIWIIYLLAFSLGMLVITFLPKLQNE